MKITNKLGLPRAFVEMARSDYGYKVRQYSVTSITNGLCETILKRRHHHELVVDVADQIWALFGQATHHILEQQEARAHEVKEEYLKVDVGEGYLLSGRFDLYNRNTNVITDYKTTSVWKIIHADYEDWFKQLLIYAWMMKQEGYQVETGQVIAILKDHSKTKAKFDSNYPPHPVEVVKFSISDNKLNEIEDYIMDRFEQIRKLEFVSDEELPTCSPEERWRDGDKWAVMKKNRKRALRVLDSQDEAVKWMKAKGKGDYIDCRPGEDKKCDNYCDVCEYCTYYQSKLEVGREEVG